MAFERPKFARNKVLREERQNKREAAQARQEKYESLSIEAKIYKCLNSPGFSNKQLGKLCAEAVLTSKAPKELGDLIDIRMEEPAFAAAFRARTKVNGEAVQRAFNATPEEMGTAAVEAAQKEKVHGLKAKERRAKAKKGKK